MPVEKWCRLLDLDTSFASDEAEIRKAFRRKALATHPDRGGENEQFRQVREAYERLLTKNFEKRVQQTRRTPYELRLRSLERVEPNIAIVSCRCGEEIPLFLDSSMMPYEVYVVLDCPGCSAIFKVYF